MPEPDVTDTDLMQSLAGGDREALGVLFARHYQTVYAMSARLCGSEAAGEDVTQEVFLRVLRAASSFSARSRFTTWMYRITRNACLDYHRNMKREWGKREKYAAEQQHIVEDGDPRISGSIERLHGALDSLEPDKREILILRRHHGLSYAEIADVCSCTVKTARVRFHRAMQSLKAKYIEHPSGPDGPVEVFNEM